MSAGKMLGDTIQFLLGFFGTEMEYLVSQRLGPYHHHWTWRATILVMPIDFPSIISLIIVLPILLSIENH